MATAKHKQKGRLATEEVLNEIRGDVDSELSEIREGEMDPVCHSHTVDDLLGMHGKHNTVGRDDMGGTDGTGGKSLQITLLWKKKKLSVVF